MEKESHTTVDKYYEITEKEQFILTAVDQETR